MRLIIACTLFAEIIRNKSTASIDPGNLLVCDIVPPLGNSTVSLALYKTARYGY